ncbi:esterase [Methylomonas sp. LL1]|uniref:hypothetical protein n=1 Tax=Methylomonas sp. LL1 TaxID=2785785 RepID=UPI0018C3D287|nr:hypothetical protein [Methylomonas sp. LL1]QPK65359.1 esterase [Methylomonas sp. LL1]
MALKKHSQQLAMLSLLLLLLSLGGCADLKNYHPNAKYRSDVAACPLKEAIPEPSEVIDCCSSYALQHYKNGQDEGYLLGFVELDEQGQLFDRQQMNTVLEEFSQYEDLLMVVFVHGWHNNADPANDNLKRFREVLMKLGKQEAALSKSEGRLRRQVAGLYIGWRGDSISEIDIPVVKQATWAPVKLLQQFTFWDRKNTAHKVGDAGLTEVLVRLDRIKKVKNKMQENGNTKLVVIGHSFGGAAVYSALSQILVHGFVNTVCPEGIDSGITDCNANGFGNLVLLINPAIEAQQFSVLHDMAIERGNYFPDQLPVLAVLASRTDVPVTYIFPFGRWFSTIFEKTLDLERYNATTRGTELFDEEKANRYALGHFEAYTNYQLNNGACSGQESSMRTVGYGTTASEKAFTFNFLQTASDAWDSGASKIPFSGEKFEGCLERNNKTAARNPYLIVSVDKEIIDGHSDLSNDNMREFIRGMVLLATQKPTAKERKEVRAMIIRLE